MIHSIPTSLNTRKEGISQSFGSAKTLWKRIGKPFIPRSFGSQDGQALIWVVFLMSVFLGLCMMTVDVGNAYLVKKELQASCDAAALAAAETLPSTAYASVAKTYTSYTGEKNAYTNVTVSTPVITGLCLTTLENWTPALTCSPATSTTAIDPNAVSVTQTAVINTYFAGFLGIPTMTVSAESTASKGGKAQPFNIAILMDTTPSMSDVDNNCGGDTQLVCAQDAFEFLLKGLDPTVDKISLFTFPPVTTDSVADEYNCSGTIPTVAPYVFPSSTATSLSNVAYTTTEGSGSTANKESHTATYQVTGFLGDYRSSESSTSLASGSELTEALGGGSCSGIQVGWNDTFYAGAIYQAQAALLAEQAANPGTQNAMIILGDGNSSAEETNSTSSFNIVNGGRNGYDLATWSADAGQTLPAGTYAAGSFFPTINDMVTGSMGGTGATSSGTYPSWVDECGQEVTAAQSATAQKTLVFTIAYGSPATASSDNCGSDYNSKTKTGISPCTAMQDMASTSADFFSDYFVTGGDSGCQATDANNTITSLQNIVNAILSQVSGARLIPNGTT